jgi:uncharacterized protein (TIGR02246 family)
MTTITEGDQDETDESPFQSMEMELRSLTRRTVTTVAIVVLAILAGSAAIRAQNDERLNNAANSTPKGSKQSQANDIPGEIAKMLRAYYDAWTKLDAAVVNSNFTNDGFVTLGGKMIANDVFKSRVRLDFASTPATGNYQFAIEDLRVFQPNSDTTVASYRLVSTPSDKNLAILVEDVTDTLARRDKRWLIFAEHMSDSPKPVEPIVSGLPSGWKRTPGGTADRYLMYVDSEVKHGGKASTSIKFNCGEDQYP